MKPEMAQGGILVSKPVMAVVEPAAAPDQAGAQAEAGLLFAVGKGKGKPEMAQDKPEMAQDKPEMAQTSQ